jgi:hypothetical protein
LVARGCAAAAFFFSDAAQHGFFAQQPWHEYLPGIEEPHAYAATGVAVVATAATINNTVAILFTAIFAF